MQNYENRFEAATLQFVSTSAEAWLGGIFPGDEHFVSARSEVVPFPVSARILADQGLGDFAGVGIDDAGGGLVFLRLGGGTSSPSGLLEAVAVAVHRQDINMVRQVIEQRAGEPFEFQDARPVFEEERSLGLPEQNRRPEK